MPEIKRVDVMKKAPARCGICNTTPTEDGKPKPAIDTNVDVDWGNNFYICDECVRVICGLWGWVPEEEHEALKDDFKRLRRDHKNLRSRFKSYEDELNKVVSGRKAERKLRKKVAV